MSKGAQLFSELYQLALPDVGGVPVGQQNEKLVQQRLVILQNINKRVGLKDQMYY